MHIPLFRIWYSTTYTVLFGILLVLLAITPTDEIYQSIKSDEYQNPAVIGSVYFLTFLIVLLIYSTRLYTNRTVLAAIPKPYIPVEDGEVGTLVRQMVVKALKRSAIVAWDSRPRDVRGEMAEDDERPGTAEKERERWHRKKHHCDATIIPVCANSPPWGHISHPGWASPASPDLPNLQYWSVICELPNLIEAKAVSLAPPDPAVEGLLVPDHTPMLPDAQIVALLQRPRSMGLREYLARLSEFGLLNPPSLGPIFLEQYEYARFSTHSVTEDEFRDIMAVFADILNGMTELDPVAIEDARAQGPESDTTSLAPTESSSSSSSQSRLLFRTPLVDRHPDYQYSEGSESPQTVRTAPSLPRNLSSGVYTLPRTPSERSLGSVRHRSSQQRSPSTILPNSSSSSIQGSAHSVRSTRSAIRLRDNPSPGDLPYQYQHMDQG